MPKSVVMLEDLKPANRGPNNWWKAPLLEDDLNRCQWEWIIAQVGEKEAEKALHELHYSHRPWPLNIAKRLHLTFPRELRATKITHYR